MSALKCLALLVLIVTGLFAIRSSNYRRSSRTARVVVRKPVAVVFAYAGFESIAQTAGEVKDSTRRLPKILLKGITVTALDLRLHVDRFVRRATRRATASEQFADG